MASLQVTSFDDPFTPRVLTRKTAVICNVLALLPLLFMFAGMGLAAAAAYLGVGQDLGPTGNYVLIGVGVVIALSSAYWGLRNSTKLSGWYLRRRSRGQVKARLDALVDPDNPEAIFVEVVPRENWKRLMLETATDVGFLLLDDLRREVLFEGDRERIRIPAAAILACEVEQILIGESNAGGMPYYFTVLRVRDGEGVRELPFAYRGDLGQFGAGVRALRALTLRDRIGTMISGST
jgi:hypothetical protein